MPGIPPIAPYPLPTKENLPENLAQWIINPPRAVILIHDMQRFPLEPFPGRLRTDLIHNAAALRKRCAELGPGDVHGAAGGRMTDQQRGLLKDFWGPGMRTDTADREVVPELTPAAGDWTFTKWRYSAFFHSDMTQRMRAAGRDQLIVCGVYAHVGVLATALDAFTHNIQPFIVADALGDFSETEHRFTLEYAARCCGMVVSAEVLP